MVYLLNFVKNNILQLNIRSSYKEAPYFCKVNFMKTIQNIHFSQSKKINKYEKVFVS